MTTVLLIFQFILAIIITIAVLLQKSSSIGLGAYSGSNESLFGAKGPAGFLTKFTFFMGVLFIVNTVALGYIYNKTANQSVLDLIKTPKELKVDKNISTAPNSLKTDNNLTKPSKK